MAGRSTDFIDIQNDDHEINLHFQEFGGTSSSMVENDGQKEQTFYFSNYPESHEDDQQRLLDDEESESTKPSHSFWSFEYYQQFFNVDSKQVGDRILWSMVPKPGVNYLKSYIRPNPDLYGPFWICVTLVFTTAITGNLANYLQTPDSYKWRYNFHKVTLATSSIFSYAWLVPILLWGMLIWRDSKANLSLLELICLYGYSLGIFVPVSLLWMIPLKWLQWCLGIVASVLSGSVLVRTILSTVHPKAKKVALALSTVILILHAALALGFMLYFFYPPPVTTPPLGPKTNSTEGPKTNSTEALVGMNRKDSYNNTSKVTREVIAKVTENLKLNIRKVEEEAVNKKSQEETVSKKEQTDVPNTMNKEDKVDEKETINNIREEAVNKLKKEETLSVSEERSGKMLEVDNNLSHVEAFGAGNQAIVSKKKEETQALKTSSFNFTKNTI